MCVVGPHRERFGLQHGPYSALAGPSTDLGLRVPEAAAAAKESPIVPSSMPVAALEGLEGAFAACERTLHILVKGRFNAHRERIRVLLGGR
jgi:hypothetical protein